MCISILRTYVAVLSDWYLSFREAVALRLGLDLWNSQLLPFKSILSLTFPLFSRQVNFRFSSTICDPFEHRLYPSVDISTCISSICHHPCHPRICVYMYVGTHVFKYILIRMYVCRPVCMYVCMNYICKFVCMHVCRHCPRPNFSSITSCFYVVLLFRTASSLN